MLPRAVGRLSTLSGRIGRRRLCTSQPGAAAAAAWAELQDEARAALTTPAYARFGMDRFLFGEVLTHGSLAEALAHELGSKFTANDRVPPGSGLPALLYSGKRVCRPPGGRGGADEGYVGRSGSLGSSMGSIWATAWPRTWPFGGVHVQSGVRKGPPTSDLCSTD